MSDTRRRFIATRRVTGLVLPVTSVRLFPGPKFIEYLASLGGRFPAPSESAPPSHIARATPRTQPSTCSRAPALGRF